MRLRFFSVLIIFGLLLAACGSESGTGNKQPVAAAGSDITVKVGETVSLDGSASSDQDGDSLTYTWSISSSPSGSSSTISDSTNSNASFIPDAAEPTSSPLWSTMARKTAKRTP